MSRVSDETLREISEGAFFGRDIDVDLANELRAAREVVRIARITVRNDSTFPGWRSLDNVVSAYDAMEDGE